MGLRLAFPLKLRVFISLLAAVIAFLTISPAARAEPGTLQVTVTFRERIALPPDAQLDVQLLDVSPSNAGATRISSQRFAMAGVPRTIDLTYDSEIIDERASYAVTAAIWSGETRIFRTPSRHDVFGEANGNRVEILLAMATDQGVAAAPSRTISGILWKVTEVMGAPWETAEPATLNMDDDMNFSIFGGCNRFRGQAVLLGNEIAFPESIAGTLMACPDDVEAQERNFIDALRRVASYVRYGAGLVMIDAGGNALLHFEISSE